MRVLMLNYEYPPLGGGAGHAAACLLEQFRERTGVAVDLVTSSPDRQRVERPAEHITIHRVNICKRGTLHYQSMRELCVYAWKARSYARRLAAVRRYQLCHAFFGIPCGVIAQGLGVPYIVSLRGSDVPFYNERFRVLDRLVFARLSERVWRGAAFVVANSQWLRRLALRVAPRQRIEVIGNGVNTQAFRPAPVPHEGLRVLCVARLIRRKRIDVLIRALALLRDADVWLTLAGTGNAERELRRLATRLGVARRVEFAGRVAEERIADLYHYSDVFVLPSRSEGMSNAVLEAMACGLPVVMADTGGAEEVLRDGENGFLLRGDSAREVAAVLRRYLLRPGLARRQGDVARRTVEGLSWQRVAERYLELYRLAARGRAA